MSLPGPIPPTLLGLLRAEVERRLRERMPGVQVRLEEDRLIIFFPMSEIVKMIKANLPEPWKYVSEVRPTGSGIEVVVKVR